MVSACTYYILWFRKAIFSLEIGIIKVLFQIIRIFLLASTDFIVCNDYLLVIHVKLLIELLLFLVVSWYSLGDLLLWIINLDVGHRLYVIWIWLFGLDFMHIKYK